MPTNSFELLRDAYADNKGMTGHHLWLLTESLADVEPSLFLRDQISAISNRWDIANSLGEHCQFSDFDFSSFETLNAVYLHIPKEKAVFNHILNQCAEKLLPGGKVTVCGEKKQGIKSVTKKFTSAFPKSTIEKHGDLYRVTLMKEQVWEANNEKLDDQRYRKTRIIGHWNGIEVYSKPGIYGWNKIDAGSLLLVEHLSTVQSHLPPKVDSVLDLGCGYGFLSIAASNMGFKNIHATDNNAAVAAAMAKNTEVGAFDLTYWADDAASQTQKKFDLVLCNPPFHQGFDHDESLSKKFLAAIARLRSPNGTALVVVNQFIKLEKLAENLFESVTLVYRNKSYSVYQLR